MKSVLVVGAGLLQVPAFEAARRRGVRSVAVDRDPGAPGMRIADAAYCVDTRDAAGIMKVAMKEAVGGVTTLCTDAPVRVVAEVAGALGLRAIAPGAAACATNKVLMRETLRAARVPIPEFRTARTLAEALVAASQVGFPAILKPPAASGSRGVFKATRTTAVEEGFRHAQGVAGNDQPILIEQFVEGPEVSVETMSFGGSHVVVAITDKRTTGDPYWVEIGHSQPTRHPREARRSIEGLALAALRALGVDDAAGHVEIKMGPSGPRLIELGARLGGDFITTELVPRSTGVDMVEGILDIALGVRPTLQPTRARGAAIRYFEAPAGRVSSIRGVEEARSMEGVVRLEVLVREGSTLAAVRSSIDRPGFVICEGRDAAEADRRAAAAAGLVSFQVD